MTGGAFAQSAVERGGYLVNTIMTCANCHSPKGPPAATAGKDYSGGLRWDEPPFNVTAPNITPDKETGIGNWTDDHIKTLLLTGKHPNGVPACRGYADVVLSDPHSRRFRRIVAYLRTLKPVKNKVPDPIYKIALPHHVFPGAEKSYAQADLNDKLKRGFYLATIGHCMECHTPFGGRGWPKISRIRSARAAANSPDPGACRSRAISLRTRPRASATGPTPRSRPRSPRASGRTARRSRAPMGYQYYANMTDADLDAVIAYVRTLPAKE